jgi:hypothetical protein
LSGPHDKGCQRREEKQQGQTLINRLVLIQHNLVYDSLGDDHVYVAQGCGDHDAKDYEEDFIPIREEEFRKAEKDADRVFKRGELSLIHGRSPLAPFGDIE